MSATTNLSTLPAAARRRALLRAGIGLAVAGSLLSCGGCAAPTSGAAAAAAPSGPAGRIERGSIASTALGTAMPFSTYLPHGYDTRQRYPVLYLFYGYGGNPDSLFGGFLDIKSAADRLIAQGVIQPLIIVAPDYANSFAVDSTPLPGRSSGGASIGLYETALTRELIPFIDTRYSTQPNRDGRFVDGFSMGGFAALYLAFSHPDLFGKVGARSAALWDYGDGDLYTRQRNWLYATPALRAARDPFMLARSADLAALQIDMDAGTSDPLFARSEDLVGVLRQRGANVRWHPGPGGHDSHYWQGRLEAMLRFHVGVPR
ncbi:MAG: esterase [Rubrivivax sp.]|nr:MAG: esterase [Rubrivivax sp.]